MKRLTSNNTFEMNAVQLALNQVHIQDGWAWYRGCVPEHDVSVCDLIRTAADTLLVELPMLSDEDLSDLMVDFLQYGEDEPEGVLAILYRALWAMAELRDKLSRYEDTELEPEEIKVILERYHAFRSAISDETGQPMVSWTRAGEICRADKDGRLVVLPPNDPLTLEGLREMGQRCEGVYVAHVDGSPVFRGWKYCAAVLDFSLAFGSNTMHIHAICGGRMTMWEDDYGKTWIAYRRKPEEATS